MEKGRNSEAKRLRDELDRRLKKRDRKGAISEATKAVATEEISIPELYEEVLTPLMVGIGASWQSEEKQVWEEHFASAVIRGIIEALYEQVNKVRKTRPVDGRSVLLACPPEEQHDLGIRMIADYFEMAGWKTYFLGADTPEDQIITAAKELKVDALVLSASTHFHRLCLRELVDRLHQALPEVRIWAGGPAFKYDKDGWNKEEILEPDTLF